MDAGWRVGTNQFAARLPIGTIARPARPPDNRLAARGSVALSLPFTVNYWPLGPPLAWEVTGLRSKPSTFATACRAARRNRRFAVPPSNLAAPSPPNRV
ncbi:hypothetical protein SBA4_3480010 [Candidatus Sulfopaludibacter sp. SbA4]|nr:hypothetical protein SBA4_3480010 [Candidatus Sulfopaludibacter sp. SbA4]